MSNQDNFNTNQIENFNDFSFAQLADFVKLISQVLNNQQSTFVNFESQLQSIDEFFEQRQFKN